MINLIFDLCDMCVLSSHQLHPLHPKTSLQWRKCAEIPKALARPQSIVIGDAVFVAAYSGKLQDVLRYDTRSNQWSVLPSCPVTQFGLGKLSGKLVTVGGTARDGNFATVNHVYTYVQMKQRWKKSIPMPTPRQLPTVISYNSSIAVCGGNGGDRVVEVFNSNTAKWYTAAPLPVACVYMQLTIINDTCYLGGGSSRSILCASIPSLFQSSSPHDQETASQQQLKWTILPDIPISCSAITNAAGTLLALGGCETIDLTSSDAIYAYSPSTKAWLIVASLPQVCSYATAELLPSGEVMLIGGYDSKGTKLKSAYNGRLDL